MLRAFHQPRAGRHRSKPSFTEVQDAQATLNFADRVECRRKNAARVRKARAKVRGVRPADRVFVVHRGDDDAARDLERALACRLAEAAAVDRAHRDQRCAFPAIVGDCRRHLLGDPVEPRKIARATCRDACTFLGERAFDALDRARVAVRKIGAMSVVAVAVDDAIAQRVRSEVRPVERIDTVPAYIRKRQSHRRSRFTSQGNDRITKAR